MIATRGNLGYYRGVNKWRILGLAVSLISLIGFIISPLTVAAEPPALTSLLITEVQTGANGSASNEFVEIYNPTDQPTNIGGWQLRYVNAGGETTTLVATVPDGVVLPAGAHYTFHGQNITAQGSGQVYSPKLSAADKTVALFGVDAATCQLVVEDAVAWATSGAITKGEGAAVSVPQANASTEKLLQRYQDSQGVYVDTNDNAYDFALSLGAGVSSPGADNALLLPADAPPAPAGSVSILAPLPIADCVIPPPDPEPIPEPDPTPQPDPDPTPDPSDDGETPPADEPSDPEPQPEVTPNAGLPPPIITELLPDPTAPQTDADDEFVELYNPGDTAFDLSGYILETGITTKYRFVFPAGSTLAPRTFVSLFSADTHLALANGGGQARLFGPENTLLGQSQEYGPAKAAQSWALVDGTWQWTTVPTPNVQNVSSPTAVAKVASVTTKAKTTKSKTAKATTAKTTKPKAASKTSKTTKTSATDTVQNLALMAPRAPLHPSVLAATGVFALLYGAYEYRRDLANKLYQLRRNRAARSAARHSAKGR